MKSLLLVPLNQLCIKSHIHLHFNYLKMSESLLTKAKFSPILKEFHLTSVYDMLFFPQWLHPAESKQCSRQQNFQPSCHFSC